MSNISDPYKAWLDGKIIKQPTIWQAANFNLILKFYTADYKFYNSFCGGKGVEIVNRHMVTGSFENGNGT